MSQLAVVLPKTQGTLPSTVDENPKRVIMTTTTQLDEDCSKGTLAETEETKQMVMETWDVERRARNHIKALASALQVPYFIPPSPFNLPDHPTILKVSEFASDDRLLKPDYSELREVLCLSKTKQANTNVIDRRGVPMLGANEARIEEAIQDSKNRLAWGINIIPLPDYHLYKKQLAKSCHATIQETDPVRSTSSVILMARRF